MRVIILFGAIGIVIAVILISTFLIFIGYKLWKVKTDKKIKEIILQVISAILIGISSIAILFALYAIGRVLGIK